MSSSHPQTIDTLLRLVPENPTAVLNHLTSHPTLALQADSTGYSLLHAAASYSQLDLLRTLVKSYNVSPDITDSEGETPLFAAETLEAARCLIEELGADAMIMNEEGMTAEQNASANMEDGGEWMLVADYLEKRRTMGQNVVEATPATAAANGDIGDARIALAQTGADGEAMQPPPPLPPGVRITGMRAVPMAEGEAQEAPDPVFRRRIEELAAREDFQDEAGQQELKNLVQEAVGGMSMRGEERDVRRRMD